MMRNLVSHAEILSAQHVEERNHLAQPLCLELAKDTEWGTILWCSSACNADFAQALAKSRCKGESGTVMISDTLTLQSRRLMIVEERRDW